MNEADIQIALHREFFSGCDVCMPNYTPDQWWECDFMHLTKAGYMVEHEIKLSRSDFFADVKKEKGVRFVRRRDGWGKVENTNKHTLLHQGDERGPRQFWFVVPEGMVKIDEVPEFAGLKFAKETEIFGNKLVTTKVVKKAPFLHKSKAHQYVKIHVGSVCYYRYWNEKEAHSSTRKRLRKETA